MYQSNAQLTTSFLDYHQKYKKKTKMVNVFRCKEHGRIDVKHDKLINVGGIKFCPFCVKNMLEDYGICQLKRSKEMKR